MTKEEKMEKLQEAERLMEEAGRCFELAGKLVEEVAQDLDNDCPWDYDNDDCVVGSEFPREVCHDVMVAAEDIVTALEQTGSLWDEVRMLHAADHYPVDDIIKAQKEARYEG